MVYTLKTKRVGPAPPAFSQVLAVGLRQAATNPSPDASWEDSRTEGAVVMTLEAKSPGTSAESHASGSERFLVTGALGCIGAWVVHEFVGQGVEVVAFNKGHDDFRIRRWPYPTNSRCRQIRPAERTC